MHHDFSIENSRASWRRGDTKLVKFYHSQPMQRPLRVAEVGGMTLGSDYHAETFIMNAP